jgi:hypothetical protein
VLRGNFSWDSANSRYEDVKIGRGWQKAKAAFYPNGKIKPNVIIYKGKEHEHPEGGYYANDRGKWIFATKDALEAQRFRAQLIDASFGLYRTMFQRTRSRRSAI